MTLENPHRVNWIFFSEIQGASTSKKSKLSKEVPLPIGYIDPGFYAAERVTEKEARLEHRLQKLAKKAFKENITLKESAKRLGYVEENEFSKFVDPKKMI